MRLFLLFKSSKRKENTPRFFSFHGKRQPGDTFIPFGMKGKKKISDYLTDRKFSISQKERQWVLCCGEHIAWLIGERTDNRFRIDKTTKRIVIYKIV